MTLRVTPNAPVSLPVVGAVAAAPPGARRPAMQRGAASQVDSLARVHVTYTSAARVDACIQRIFGKPLTPTALAKLTGAPPGARIDVKVERRRLALILHSPLLAYPLDLKFFKDKGGVHLYVELWMNGPKAPPGTGSAWFGRMVTALSEAGVASIQCCMAKGDENLNPIYNGYYTWPRFGFDAELSKKDRKRLPKTLAHATHISDLMMVEAGRAWWKKHGDVYYGVFDLRPDSLSMLLWTTYQQMRAQSAGKSTP